MASAKIENLQQVSENLETIGKSIDNANTEIEALTAGITGITTAIDALQEENKKLMEKGTADAAELTKIETALNDMQTKVQKTSETAASVKKALEEATTKAQPPAPIKGGGMHKNSAKKQFRNLISYISTMSRKTQKHHKKHRKH